MGYFDGLTNASFKKSQDGSTVFYPWGVLGKGRILPDEAAEAKVRGFVKRYYKIMLPTVIIVCVMAGWIWALPLAAIFGAWFYFGSRALVAAYPYSDDKLTLKQGYANSAIGHNQFVLWLLFVFSVLFVVGGIFIAYIAKSPGQMMTAVSAIVFFGACGLAIGYMIKVKRALRKGE
ncbi:hypothetical protein BCF11_4120 [Collimonas sp. PA-H2]|uniref:hypothetical protein n=1 Tax=Collimonas sp. PA-H2 TaxID=1881062 RepID=UPI000BF9F11B|nr:hypothetical protein [Collimonas sp. PA-H2]PFH11665.1 hypothetical protein BCF11_4120 [Collimonas sp. PA-H2]